jgi:hypothetical protein
MTPFQGIIMRGKGHISSACRRAGQHGPRHSTRMVGGLHPDCQCSWCARRSVTSSVPGAVRWLRRDAIAGHELAQLLWMVSLLAEVGIPAAGGLAVGRVAHLVAAASGVPDDAPGEIGGAACPGCGGQEVADGCAGGVAVEDELIDAYADSDDWRAAVGTGITERCPVRRRRVPDAAQATRAARPVAGSSGGCHSL